MGLGGYKDVESLAFDEGYRKRKQKERSRKQERRVASKLGGSRVPLSGADSKAKGDVSLDLCLVEVKGTAKKSLRIERSWLEKITVEAMAEGKTPAFSFGFEEYDNPVTPRDWVALPAELVKELLDGF